jgi:Protein of unknown function (DUF4058)
MNMAGPFSGMDPYLEHPAHWSDFHARFINYWCEALAEVLPEHCTARIGERVNLIQGPPPEKKQIVPDVAIERQPGPASRSAVALATAPAVKTGTLPLLVFDEPLETYIEVLHRPDRSLVAVLELLSPANKEEPGYNAYLLKRNALLFQKVHLVEVDLLMGGKRLPFRAPLPAGDYFAFIAHAARRPDCDYWAWGLPDPLPTISIPLLAPDPDVPIDLGKVLTTAYERGRFGREIDYAAPPPVTLDDERMRWVAKRVGPGPS